MAGRRVATRRRRSRYRTLISSVASAYREMRRMAKVDHTMRVRQWARPEYDRLIETGNLPVGGFHHAGCGD